MTLCAAAICHNHPQTGPVPVLLGISDRMLTSGDIEFESGQSKIYVFDPANTVALVSGNYDAHFEIAIETHRQVRSDHVTDVGQIAELYAKNLLAYRTKRASRLLLAPLGLDVDSFISRQQEMDSDIVQEIVYKMLGEESDIGIDTIIAGIDSTGAHIYRVTDPGEASCCDGSGFVAVGSGSRQFETQFMSMS